MIRAILPPAFRHGSCNGLIRLGSDNDGGYVVAENDVLRADCLLSFGIGDDWEFERQFSRLNAVPVTAFDGSVRSRDFRTRALLSAFGRREEGNPARLLRSYLDFRRFFKRNPRNRHIAKHVGIGQNHVSMRAVLGEANAANAFIKMDIEGSEYRCLDALIAFQDAIAGAVIEFHDVDFHIGRIEDFIRRFELGLVHIHANNFAPVGDDGLPQVLELTFSRYGMPDQRERVYPHRLDRPNNPGAAEIAISFAAA